MAFETMDVDGFREVMGSVPAGVSVLTLAARDGSPHGMTISSLVAVSYEPPSILVCVGEAASTRPHLVEGQRFCINVLGSDQSDASLGFSYGEGDPFQIFEWVPAGDGTPVLGGTAGHLMCEVERVVEHHGTAVVLAGVVGGVIHGDEMLVYWKKRYFGGLVPVASEATGRW